MKKFDPVTVYKEVLSGKRKRFPNYFWSYNNKFEYENAKQVTIYLIEQILKWDDKQIKKKLSRYTFRNNGLTGMLTVIFNGSAFSALDNAYPGRFHEWELSATPRNYWNLSTAKYATTWLIEEKLHWSDEDIRNKISSKVFKQYGLYGMAINNFHGNTFKIIDNAYPGKFKKEELKLCRYKYC